MQDAKRHLERETKAHKLNQDLQARSTPGEMVDNRLLVSSPDKMASSLQSSAHDLQEGLGSRSDAKFLERTKVLKRPGMVKFFFLFFLLENTDNIYTQKHTHTHTHTHTQRNLICNPTQKIWKQD